MINFYKRLINETILIDGKNVVIYYSYKIVAAGSRPLLKK